MGLIVVVSGMALWGFGGGGEGPTVGGYYSLDIHLVSLCTNTFSRAQVAGWSSGGAADVERIPKAKTEFPVITTDPHLLSSTSWAGEVQFLTSRRAPLRSAPNLQSGGEEKRCRAAKCSAETALTALTDAGLDLSRHRDRDRSRLLGGFQPAL